MSVLLDSRLAISKAYALQVSIFHNGQLHQLSVQALAVHESLVGAQGFKHGFQFVEPTDAFKRAVDDILA